MKNALKVFVFATVLFMFNCGGDDTPAIIPTVEFSHERSVVEVGDEVEFVSTHTEAASFAWDFGDGNTSTDQNPTHTYSELGEHTVTLTVTSSTGNTAESTSMITVGKRFILGFSINSVNMTDSNGDPWDADNGPDLFFGYAPAAAQDIQLFNMGEDLTENDFPVGGTLPEDNRPELTDEDWNFLFIDNDEPFDDINESQVMAAITFNPATREADEKDFELGQGVYTIVIENYSFTILYEIKVQ